jgi:hypothetical protein
MIRAGAHLVEVDDEAVLFEEGDAGRLHRHARNFGGGPLPAPGSSRSPVSEGTSSRPWALSVISASACTTRACSGSACAPPCPIVRVKRSHSAR